MAATKKKSLGQKVSARGGRRWILAIDPYAGFDVRPLLKFSAAMAESAGARLLAVYVLAPAALNWTGEFSGPWMSRYLPLAAAKIRELLRGEMPYEIVTCRQPGIAAASKRLLAHARKIGTDRILIATHARQGLDRWAFGSFAERLVEESKIPVMVINPAQTLPGGVRKILVPVDLGPESTKFVLSVAGEAKRLGAEVVLYYKQTDPMDPIVQQGVYSLGGGWVSLQAYVEEESERRARDLERLEERLRRKGLRVSHVIDDSPRDLVESIDQTARDLGADLVSVQTHASGWTATLLGSVTRGLVRTSPVPVLVHH